MALVPKQTSAYNISNSSTFTKSLSRYGEGLDGDGRAHRPGWDASPVLPAAGWEGASSWLVTWKWLFPQMWRLPFPRHYVVVLSAISRMSVCPQQPRVAGLLIPVFR